MSKFIYNCDFAKITFFPVYWGIKLSKYVHFVSDFFSFKSMSEIRQ